MLTNNHDPRVQLHKHDVIHMYTSQACCPQPGIIATPLAQVSRGVLTRPDGAFAKSAAALVKQSLELVADADTELRAILGYVLKQGNLCLRVCWAMHRPSVMLQQPMVICHHQPLFMH